MYKKYDVTIIKKDGGISGINPWRKIIVLNAVTVRHRPFFSLHHHALFTFYSLPKMLQIK